MWVHPAVKVNPVSTADCRQAATARAHAHAHRYLIVAKRRQVGECPTGAAKQALAAFMQTDSSLG